MANQDFTLLVGTKIDDTGVLNGLKQTEKKATITVRVNAKTGDLEKIKKEFATYTDSAGKVIKTTTFFDKENNNLGTVITNTTEKIKDQSTALENISTNADKTSKSVKGLAKDFVETTGKVAKFGLSTAVIGVFYSAIQEAKEAVFGFNSALTEFTKVSDLSGESLDSYINKLDELGEVTGRSRTQMLEAATEFKKTGASDEEAAQLAQLATLYQNVADSEISAGQSANYITSQMKAFNITADDAISILDKTNEVSNRFAVSSTDISSALTKTSGAMATYGNTIDETIGLTVAG